MHLAAHHPTVFAAAAPSVGWVDPATTSLNYFPYFGSTTEHSVPWEQWNDQAWLIANRQAVPPIIYTFGKDDPIVSAAAYPNLLAETERTRKAYFARWQNTGHSQFYLTENADVMRFKLNEAYPAFAAAGNSDSFAAQEGQRNVGLDWSSALHSLGGGTGIADTAANFAMSFKSLNSDTTANVTIRNAQSFVLAPGEQVSWWNLPANGGAPIQAGIVAADSGAVVTMNVAILAAGNRLVLARGTDGSNNPPNVPPGPPAPPLPPPPPVLAAPGPATNLRITRGTN
jgi:hypothetical protein